MDAHRLAAGVIATLPLEPPRRRPGRVGRAAALMIARVAPRS